MGYHRGMSNKELLNLSYRIVEVVSILTFMYLPLIRSLQHLDSNFSIKSYLINIGKDQITLWHSYPYFIFLLVPYVLIYFYYREFWSLIVLALINILYLSYSWWHFPTFKLKSEVFLPGVISYLLGVVLGIYLMSIGEFKEYGLILAIIWLYPWVGTLLVIIIFKPFIYLREKYLRKKLDKDLKEYSGELIGIHDDLILARDLKQLLDGNIYYSYLEVKNLNELSEKYLEAFKPLSKAFIIAYTEDLIEKIAFRKIIQDEDQKDLIRTQNYKGSTFELADLEYRTKAFSDEDLNSLLSAIDIAKELGVATIRLQLTSLNPQQQTIYKTENNRQWLITDKETIKLKYLQGTKGKDLLVVKGNTLPEIYQEILPEITEFIVVGEDNRKVINKLAEAKTKINRIHLAKNMDEGYLKAVELSQENDLIIGIGGKE